MVNPDDYIEGEHLFKSGFGFKNRFIGNYLTRKLKEGKFESDEFNRIVIIACQHHLPETTVYEKFLRICIPFNKDEYLSTNDELLTNYLLKMYNTGIEKAAKTHHVFQSLLLQESEKFRQNNFENKWLFKAKSFKEKNIRVKLDCEMTADKFILYLTIENKKGVIFNQPILETLPDEIIFHYQFKDLVLNGSTLQVINAFKEPVYSVDLASLAI